MADIEEVESNRPTLRFVRPALTVVAALLLGALGSGLWELVLKDLLASIGNTVLSFLASIWSGYLDTIYKRVGTSGDDFLVRPVFGLVVAAFLVAPWMTIATLLASPLMH